MRKGSNQQTCGSTVGCYDSVGLNIEHTNVSRQLLEIVVLCKLSFFGHTIRDGDTVVTSQNGRLKAYRSNIAGSQWMEEIGVMCDTGG